MRACPLDDDYLRDLKAEIIQAKGPATDGGGVVLVWLGGPLPASAAVGRAIYLSAQQCNNAYPPAARGASCRPRPGWMS